MPEVHQASTHKVVFGDTSDQLDGFSRAEDQDLPILLTSPENSVTVIGDAGRLTGFAQGGDDDIIAHGFIARALGDTFSLLRFAHGGDDGVTANSFSSSLAYGDAELIGGHAVGGDDQVSAGSSEIAIAYGDAALITDFGRGGNDTVTGGTSLRGSLDLFGDAERLEDHSFGGDDVLIAPLTAATMWGDAAFVGPWATTGADRFVISFGNLFGHSIMDFEPGKDVVQLVGYGVATFEELASHFVPGSAGVVIDFGPTDSVFLAGVTVGQLGAGDFLLS